MGAVNSSSSGAESADDELHQEPEAAPYYPSSTPLSPLLSLTRGTSCNILSPGAHRLQTMTTAGPEPVCTEVYLIRHAESSMNARPELIGGRSPSATLTSLGKRQARALGLHFRAAGMEFDAVWSSPLERALQTAYALCQELGIPREAVEAADAVQELSQGQWEGRSRSEIYTPATVSVVNSTQPDFRAPGGESQRQVEFRMVEFLTNIVLPRASSSKRGSRDHHNKWPQANSALDTDNTSQEADAASGSSSLKQNSCSSSQQSGEFHSNCDEEKPCSVAVVSHGMAIKCLLRGLTGSDPHFTTRWCIDNTSVTVVRHSTRKGWEIQRVNDTSHLRLL